MNKEQELRQQIYELQIRLTELECQKKQGFQKTYSLLPKRFKALNPHTQKLGKEKTFKHNTVQALDVFSADGKQIFELDVFQIRYDKKFKEYSISYVEFRNFSFVHSQLVLDENLIKIKKLHHILSLRYLNRMRIICNFLELDDKKIRELALPRTDWEGKEAA